MALSMLQPEYKRICSHLPTQAAIWTNVLGLTNTDQDKAICNSITPDITVMLADMFLCSKYKPPEALLLSTGAALHCRDAKNGSLARTSQLGCWQLHVITSGHPCQGTLKGEMEQMDPEIAAGALLSLRDSHRKKKLCPPFALSCQSRSTLCPRLV